MHNTMIKQNGFGKDSSPSIMEPTDEAPSLSLTDDLLDAMRPSIPYKTNSFSPILYSDMEPNSILDNSTNGIDLTTIISECILEPKMKVSSIANGSVLNSYNQFPSLSSNYKTLETNVQNATEDFKSINMLGDHHFEKSFLLMDGNEDLRVPTVEKFCKHLGLRTGTGGDATKIKVVSIFGNTGDGKSHTMNHAFFRGEQIFRTSSSQDSCTLGVWAALQLEDNILCLDTEGLLGASHNENQRMRMLLKVLAISDIAIYRTRSERLHNDMFTFLGTASKAFHKHFATALQSMSLPGPPQSLGPAVIIFHETRNTQVIRSTVDRSSEDIIRERFANMNIDLEAFSSLRYVGIQTLHPPTDYTHIHNALRYELQNTAVRSPRTPEVVFRAMEALNIKFSGAIARGNINPFPEQYFTCGITCESCLERCERSMGHVLEGLDHRNSKRCRYQHQYENKVFICKQCHINGREVIVKITSQNSNDTSWLGLAKYAWSGSVIECPNCGEIYRARQYWYGNKTPEDAAVRSEIIHVWKDGFFSVEGPKHSAQMMVDGVNYFTETMCNIGAQPSKAITSWMADKIAPTYWKPNSDIINCHACKIHFEQTGLLKHHCRGCGEGFCSTCSANELPVPGRGWSSPVRVCDSCKAILTKTPDACPDVSQATKYSPAGRNDNADALIEEDSGVLVRKYGEVVLNTLSSVASVLEYPKDLIKESARPSYWVPDEEAPSCYVCKSIFGTAEELAVAHKKKDYQLNSPHRQPYEQRRHHCRECGQAVCNNCSLGRRPVPERGWLVDVRVCDLCNRKN